jgi:hypothetical protein
MTEVSIAPIYKVPSPGPKTEDDGKIFEMAICLFLETVYDGTYKYTDPKNQEKMAKILDRLRQSQLGELLGTTKFTHTAKKGARYDFTSIGETNEQIHHLSAKTCKKGIGKVAPQVIGQCQPSKFCEVFDNRATCENLKEWIQENTATVLEKMMEYTFDCPNIYYNVASGRILYITLAAPIPWRDFEFKWTRGYDEWTNSSTVKMVKKECTKETLVSIAEFQFHTKSRTNMANRWVYDNLWKLFPENFMIVEL